MLNIKRIAISAMSLLLAASVLGCSGTKQETGGEKITGSITAVGSTAMQPLVEEAATQFMSKNPDAQIVVQGGGSGTGLAQVQQGAANIGNSDVFAEEKSGVDASQLKDHKIAVAGMAVVINPSAGVSNVTQQQLIDIYTGKITNWKEVGGADQKITLINRPKGSGTRATFKKYALKGAEEATGIEQDSSGTVKQIIVKTPGAIGYFALSYLDNTVQALKLDGVEPSKENIITGKYPVWAYEHMYTKGESSGLTKAFLDYMVSPDVQTKIIPELGYIPVTEMKVTRNPETK